MITTKASDYYHSTEECSGFRAGRTGSDHAGYTLHPILDLSEADAQAAGKKPCNICVGRS